MSTGIYKLVFKNGFYIGQSLHIEHRYKDHLYSMRTNIKCSKKLQEAYTLLGEPELEILELCPPEELNTREQFYLDKLKATELGYNTSKIAAGGPGLHGEQHGNARYSNEVYFNILYALVTSNATLKTIAKNLNVSLGIVKSISSLQAHSWLGQEYPALYSTLKSKSRNIKTKDRQLKSPDGTIYTMGSLTSFCRDNNLTVSKVSQVLSGKAVSHKGWTLPTTKLDTSLIHKTFGIVVVKSKLEFAKVYNLDHRRVGELCCGKLKSYNGWTLYNSEKI